MSLCNASWLPLYPGSVGDLLGYMGAANLENLSGALQSYQKALAIREASARARPGDPAIQFELLNEYFHLSFVLLDVGDSKGALEVLSKGLPVAEGLSNTQADPKYRDMLAGFYWRTGSIQNETGDYPQAAENFRRPLPIREPIALVPKANPWFRTHLAADYAGLAKALQNTGGLNAGLDAARKALQLLDQLSRSDPNNATLASSWARHTSQPRCWIRQEIPIRRCNTTGTRTASSRNCGEPIHQTPSRGTILPPAR